MRENEECHRGIFLASIMDAILTLGCCKLSLERVGFQQWVRSPELHIRHKAAIFSNFLSALQPVPDNRYISCLHLCITKQFICPIWPKHWATNSDINCRQNNCLFSLLIFHQCYICAYLLHNVCQELQFWLAFPCLPPEINMSFFGSHLLFVDGCHHSPKLTFIYLWF